MSLRRKLGAGEKAVQGGTIRDRYIVEMVAINRSAVIVIPAQPFLDWLHRADPTSTELSLDDLGRDPTVYLLPEYESDEEAGRLLRKRCREIFEDQLDGWYRVPSAWPVDRSFDVFKRWFDYRFHSVLVDLGGDRLTGEAV